MAIRHEVRTEKGTEVVKKLTARKALQHNCYECMGWQKNEIRKCTDRLCACWPFRTNDTPKDTC